MPPYVRITGGNIVTSARADEYTPYENYTNGHIERNDEKAYPLGVGIAYIDGPASSVTMRGLDGQEYDIPQGYALVALVDKASPPCTSINMRPVAIRYPSEGTYSMWLIAGYGTEKGFAITEYRPYTVSVTSPPPQPSPTPTPTPQPPAPGAPRIPMEWLLLFMFFLLAIAVVVAAVRR